jgi:hypothetical protein
MPEPTNPLPEQLREALQRGRLVEVLKLVRRAREPGQQKPSGAGAAHAAPKRADDAFDGLPGSLADGLAPGEVPRSSSNGWLLVVVVLVAYLVYHLFVRAG